MREFGRANEILHKEDRGPEFSRALYASIAPGNLPENRGYLWSQDLIEGAYEAFSEGSSEHRLPIKQLGIGKRTPSGLVHPTFYPEMAELGKPKYIAPSCG